MNGTTVLLTAIGYVSFLFLIAWWGDGAGRRFLSGRSRAFVYALSLAVYCTSWTYYGSVGLASRGTMDPRLGSPRRHSPSNGRTSWTPYRPSR